MEFSTEPVSVSAKQLNLTITQHNSTWDSVAYKLGVSTHSATTTTTTPILKNINVSIAPGQVVAILGSSGSGKTSLLHALAGRNTTSGNLTGTISFNHNPQAEFVASGKVAYVKQQDFLMPYLTVRETLRYVAELRLPATLSRAAKYAQVESVMLDLGLSECANTIVGDDWQKGISGGEKRRVSVGCQLLVNPSCIFLDEATTGLDSFTSRALVETLVALSRKGRTIFISIHQARSDIFKLFDSIILMAQGQLVYAGSASDVVPYFASLGHSFPLDANPADLLIDITSIDSRSAESEALARERVGHLIDAWIKHEASKALADSARSVPASTDQPVAPNSIPSTEVAKFSEIPLKPIQAASVAPEGLQNTQRASPFSQAFIICRRSFRNVLRDNLSLWGNLLEVVLVAILFGAIFYQLPETYQGVLTRRAALYIITSIQPYLMVIFYIYKQTRELQVFDRERSDQMYQVFPFLVGNYVSQLPFNLSFPVIFSVITYFMLGLRTDDLTVHFGRFCLGNILGHQVVVAYSTFCVAAFRDFANASLLGNSLFTFFSFSTGFFLQLDSMPVYVRWISKISFLTYEYRLLSSNEFSNNVYACAATNPICIGNNVLQTLAVSVDDYTPNYIALFVIFCCFAVLAFIILLFKPVGQTQHAAPVKSKMTLTESLSVEEDNRVHNSANSVSSRSIARVDIQLINVRLEIIAQSVISRKLANKVILEDINASFPAGSVSCILGASGAGKSTLLNLLTARIMKLGAFSRWNQTGSILFNGHEELNPRRISSVCSFVRQDDSSLLPALTALETLVYAAILRLPSHLTRSAKVKRAEEMLLMLGLKHCANTVVGDEMKKGLSGGEKRRLSIGIQLLTDPSVLVVDEPTSGLDSWSAHQIMLLLKGLANEGRTVICSIHQPRTDIYNTFDNILLLGRGGRTIYSGPQHQILAYFEAELQLHLPPLTNPADFILDLSSIDLRSAEQESISRAQVDRLINYWKDRSTKYPDGESLHMSSEKNRILNEQSGASLERIQLRAMAPFSVSFPALLSRSTINTYRQPHIVISRILQVVFLGVIQVLFYARQGNGQVAVQNRLGIIQQTLSTLFVGLLNCVAVFPNERDVLFYEHADQAYSVFPWFLAYNVIEIPVEMMSAVIYTILVMLAIGLNSSVAIFFTMCLVVFGLVNAGESIGVAFCSIVRHVGFSVSMTNSLLSAVLSMSGILSSSMPLFLDRINRISSVAYGTRLLVVNEFNSDASFTCTDAEVSTGTCLFRTGQSVLNSLVSPGSDMFIFDPNQMHMYFEVFVGLTFAYRVISFLILKWKA